MSDNEKEKGLISFTSKEGKREGMKYTKIIPPFLRKMGLLYEGEQQSKDMAPKKARLERDDGVDEAEEAPQFVGTEFDIKLLTEMAALKAEEAKQRRAMEAAEAAEQKRKEDLEREDREFGDKVVFRKSSAKKDSAVSTKQLHEERMAIQKEREKQREEERRKEREEERRKEREEEDKQRAARGRDSYRSDDRDRNRGRDDYRDRDRERDRDRDRDTDRGRNRDRGRDYGRDSDRGDRSRDRERQPERERDRDRDQERSRGRDGPNDRERDERHESDSKPVASESTPSSEAPSNNETAKPKPVLKRIALLSFDADEV